MADFSVQMVFVGFGSGGIKSQKNDEGDYLLFHPTIYLREINGNKHFISGVHLH